MKNIPLYEVRTINNLKEMLASSAEIFGSKAAFLVKKKEGGAYSPISFTQYKKDVDAFGTALVNLGLKNKRIALIGEGRYEWAVSYLAAVNGTGIIVPLDKELPANEIESLLVRARVSAVIYSGKLAKSISGIMKNLDFIKYFICMDEIENAGSQYISYENLMRSGRESVEKGNKDFIDAVINNEVMSILLFTSGTTEMSKAVMLSHKNIAANLMAMCSMLYIDEKDTFLSVLPLHHTYECTCGFLSQILR